jgi:hypothetical protein
METVVFIILGIAWFALVFAVFFGKPSKDEPVHKPKGDMEIVWKKLDEHEKSLGE